MIFLGPAAMTRGLIAFAFYIAMIIFMAIYILYITLIHGKTVIRALKEKQKYYYYIEIIMRIFLCMFLIGFFVLQFLAKVYHM